MSASPEPSSGDATLDALVRDLSKKVRTTDGAWVRENTNADVPSIHADFEGALRASPKLGENESSSSVSVEAQAEALRAALDDSESNPGGSSGARIIDVGDFEQFMGDDMRKEADELVALMMQFENIPGSGSGSSSQKNKTETTSDDVAATLADAATEFNKVNKEFNVIAQEDSADGDTELKTLMKKLASDLKEEKAGKK